MTVQVIIDWFPYSSIDSAGGRVRYSEKGKVEVCTGGDLKRLEGRVRLATGLGYFILCDEMHDWFMAVDSQYRRRVTLEKLWVEDAEAKYRREKDRCAFVLNFKELSLATMFKVMFGGEPKL